jgi:long-subunit fatty acid transport protein
VDDSYQSAFGFVSPSFTVGAGFAWKITDMLTLDAGVMSTFYQDVNLTYFDVKLQEWNDKYPAIYSGNNYVSGEYTEKLSKRHLVVSAGITYSILKTEK